MALNFGFHKLYYAAGVLELSVSQYIKYVVIAKLLLLTVLGFNLLGDGIRDVLDPKMKK